MADDALRVMASARVNYGKSCPADFSPEALEHDMTFIGLCGMIDPVRPEVKDAVAEAHSAGIHVVMITGDHIDTAVAIASELGIIQDRRRPSPGPSSTRSPTRTSSPPSRATASTPAFSPSIRPASSTRGRRGTRSLP